MGWKVGWRVCSPGRTIKQLKFILRRGLLICFPVIIEGISLVPDPSQVSYKNSFTKYRGCALMTSSRSSSSTSKSPRNKYSIVVRKSPDIQKFREESSKVLTSPEDWPLLFRRSLSLTTIKPVPVIGVSHAQVCYTKKNWECNLHLISYANIQESWSAA